MDSETAGIAGAFCGATWGLAALWTAGLVGLVAMGLVWLAFASPAWRMRWH